MILLKFSINGVGELLDFILFGACLMDVGGESWYHSSWVSCIRFLISFLEFMVTDGHGIIVLGVIWQTFPLHSLNGQFGG